MVCRCLFLLILFIGIPIATFSQKGLDKLLQPDLVVPEVVQYNTGLYTFFEISDIQATYMNGITQHLIKNSNGLYLLPDGTGRVYKVVKEEEKLRIIRQDSTLFFGYNFGFFPFSYNDTLYSFGGYGYWRFNGHLRAFISQRGEWELINLNREIPYTRVGYSASPKWLDQINGQLWIGFSSDSREGVKKKNLNFNNIIDSVYVLSLDSKNWKTAGRLTSKIKDIANTPVNRSLGSSPWGQLIHDQTKSVIYLIDFSNNELLTLNPEDTRLITQLLDPRSIIFFRDSTIFVGLPSSSFDSVNLSKSEFINTKNQIYYPVESTLLPFETYSFVQVILWIAGGIFVISLSYFYYSIRSKSNGTNRKSEKLNDSVIKLFDEKEMDIIRLLISNSSIGKGTSIEDMNKSLGVIQKNPEIQKKQRSEILISINRKWRFKNGNQLLLIKKRRIEEDKRSFEYFIEFENLESIRQFIR